MKEKINNLKSDKIFKEDINESSDQSVDEENELMNNITNLDSGTGSINPGKPSKIKPPKK